MADGLIPQAVQQFILDNIDSIAELECLLLLRNQPEEDWNAESVAQRLYISNSEAAYVLQKMQSRGLFTQTGSRYPHYTYTPHTPELESRVNEVANVYAKYLVPVTHLVHSKSKSRIHEFSDAFRLRKE